MANPKQFSDMMVIGLREPRQFNSISDVIHAGGGRAIAVPTYKLKYLSNDVAAISLLQRSDTFDLAIFSSPNAVAALEKVAVINSLALDPNLTVTGPGQQTTRALQTLGFKNIIQPDQLGTMESLLSHSDLGDLSTKHVALVQRLDAPQHTLLKLRKICAKAIPIYCYQRSAAPADMWLKLEPSVREHCNCLLAYYAPSLQLLLERAGNDAPKLRQLPVGVHHSQIADKAKILGFSNIIIQTRPIELLSELAAQVRPHER